MPRPNFFSLLLSTTLFCLTAAASDNAVDFNRDISPILSNTCYKCHGPDAAERKGGTKNHALRLDTPEGAYANYEGDVAIAPGHPEKSAVVERITSADDDQVMPPPKSGKKLSANDIELIKRWISQGAKYAMHWSYVKPVRPELPEVKIKAWPHNAIDNFLLARLEKDGLKPQPEADRYALIRRVSLDLIGIPPTLEEVDAFINDKSPDAYEKLVDRLLARPAYGEHWARMWLDLARYADSGGYASDTPRTIWAYRDYVIKSFNDNKPFDKFTLEQIAGDLLPNPTEEQIVATAFHRNTMTNTEGGTTREEFRNAAIIDRVNTTLAVWMGTSINCAQCHDHKYDPIPQKDFFRCFAVFNNTEDADRPDEEPTHKFYSQQQIELRAKLEAEAAAIERKFKTPTPEQLAAQSAWEKSFPLDLKWQSLDGAANEMKTGGGKTTDIVTVDLPRDAARISALRIEAGHIEPPKGKEKAIVVSSIRAALLPTVAKSPDGRFVRIELPGKAQHLMLAEVQVFSGGTNIAPTGIASQISTDFGGDAKRANDGKTDGDFFKASSVSHTTAIDNPWWEVDLKAAHPIDQIVVWNRTDGGTFAKLKNFHVIVLDAARKEVWRTEVKEAPSPSKHIETGSARALQFTTARTDSGPAGYDEEAVIREGEPAKKEPAKKGKKPAAAEKPGWSIALNDNKTHALTLLAPAPIDIASAGSKLKVTIVQNSLQELPTPAATDRFKLAITADLRADQLARTPGDVVQALAVPAETRTADQRETVTQYFLEHIATDLKADSARLAAIKKQLADLKPVTVPIMREVAGNGRRKTRVQLRGNYLSLGDPVTEGVPEALHPLPAPEPATNRLALAKWLVDDNNPLTPRVIANRYWEQIFGVGIVRTSEEFGSQGEPPSNPELLDWLATELIREKWDMKKFAKLLVMSAAYRQSSKVTPELIERDPENRLLARGPRFRMSAEMIRDQALAVSGLLSSKMYGPSVKPPRPNAGLTAAFGGGLDWQTSSGEDKYRRALYTEMRRTSPYPSTATFDAPSREICTLRRVRTNTPLQALVTLNDPVYVEAAQALARRMAAAGTTPQGKATFGFRTVLARPPHDAELARLIALQTEAREAFSKDLKKSLDMSANPIGPLPKGADAADLAAWTTVANVLLNLDETMMKR